MIYSVRARWLSYGTSDFYRKLIDGTIAHLHPDGPEILASMRRARITAPGVVEWTERCHCDSPLAHERQTVYDHHFGDIQVTPIQEHEPALIAGEPFMRFLAQQA